MERRHQVFVSSTYSDLKEERSQIIHALLELDCMPAGMELFPAADKDSWSLIKGVIEDSDYYIVIVGGRYGSTDSEGISFTEREYDHAVSIGRPVLAFLHEQPGKLPSERCESTEAGKARLTAFRAKLEQRHCKYWQNAADLGGKVSRSLIHIRKQHPSPGWVPGRFAADEGMLRKMEDLRSRIAELEAEANAVTTKPPPGSEDLVQGQDTYAIDANLNTKAGLNKQRTDVSLLTTWDNIFSYVGAALAGECGEDELLEKVRLVFWHAVPANLTPVNNYKDIVIPHVVFDQIKAQLQALGLIMPGTRRRPVSDHKRYWKLTPYGQRYHVQIRAIRREKTEPIVNPPAPK